MTHYCVKTQREGVSSINSGTQYGAVGGSQWMLALKVGTFFCVLIPGSESIALAVVECWHPLATANGSALSAMSRPVSRFRTASVASGCQHSTWPKTITEPLAVASFCQTQPALKYSW